MMEGKVHWTQTDEGRKRMADVQRKRWREARRHSRAEKAVRIAKAKTKVKRHTTTNGYHGSLITISGESVIINGWRITPDGEQLKLEKV